jgi:hypothetical protein
MYDATLGRVRVTIVAVEKQWVVHILCVCSLSYTVCKAHAPYFVVICGLAGFYQSFSRYSVTDTIFGKKLLNAKCVFWFSMQNLSETFVILRRIKRDTIKNMHKSSCKVPVTMVRFWWNLNFLDGVPKNSPISNFMKIRPMVAELFRTDGQMDVTNLIFAFRNFCESA